MSTLVFVAAAAGAVVGNLLGYLLVRFGIWMWERNWRSPRSGADPLCSLYGHIWSKDFPYTPGTQYEHCGRCWETRTLPGEHLP